MKYGIPALERRGDFVFGNPGMALRLILIRHGDLGEGCRGRYIGRTDAPLSPEGRRQAKALAAPLAHLGEGRCLSSPLLRSRETAGLALAGAQCGIDADLREINFGRWEGMTFDEIAAADRAAVDRWAALEEGFAFPGGEGIGAFRGRIAAAAGRIAGGGSGTVVAFTHGGVIRLLICHFLGLEARDYLLFDIGTASITELRVEDGRGVLTRLNDRHHLEELRED